MNAKVSRNVIAGLLVLAACGEVSPSPTPDYREVAERYLEGVYACVPGRLAELAAEDVVLSYPVFETIFGEPTIEGREAVERFSARFCSRWEDPELRVYEALQDGNRVALVWGFEATPVTDDSVASPREGWGGISVFTFDAKGRVVREIGEESTPGPIGRLRSPP